jgi:hypothetical protein
MSFMNSVEAKETTQPMVKQMPKHWCGTKIKGITK